ncbi:hypothetical protein GCM10028806_39930 [Spirosoma terrae]|uniref:Porin family protein n=1 Tax=Spirosoma terrae TaxID=1968276 RepID=A0A6L9LHN3_9BACT|nr:hypothetical protein [Spirosoma terrae]NDU98711.1 hypothetical protein [Spirosoma terrae]
MIKLFSTTLAFFLLTNVTLLAQDTPTRELGLRTSNLSSFGLIYKKQRSENTYRRYRLAFGNLGGYFVNNNSNISFSAGGAIGNEKRRAINDKFQFIYGTELIANIGFNSTTSGSVTIDNGNGSTTTITGSSLILVSPSVGVGFVLGGQYNVNPNWYVSAELIPSVSVNGNFGDGISYWGFQAGFNSSSVGITGAYRF